MFEMISRMHKQIPGF